MQRSSSPARLCAALLAIAAALSLLELARILPSGDWIDALLQPDPDNVAEAVALSIWLPRILVAWLVGAGLGAIGAVLQQILRNPLAEPTTLGTAAGAQLALVAGALWAPWLLDASRTLVAFAGGLLATAAVFALALRRAFSPLSLILAGLIVSLAASAAATTLALLNDTYLNLAALSLWGSGTLDLQGWSTVGALWLPVVLAIGLAALFSRPLGLMEMGDAQINSLGLGATFTRSCALLLAVALAAAIVARVGVIGFVGLASPILVRMNGGRRFTDRLIWSPVVGASLLWLTDAAVQMAGPVAGSIVPTGALTALLGVPLMLWQVRRMHDLPAAPLDVPAGAPALRPASRWGLPLCALLAVALLAVALLAGAGPHGWMLDGPAAIARLLPFRAPRVAAGALAGGMLAFAGALIQRLTGNPMASPEVLGVTSGAALGFVLLLVAAPAAEGWQALLASGLGAGVTLALVLAFGRRGGTDRAIVVGIAVAALLSSVLAVLVAAGALQSAVFLNWMAGSTYGATAAGVAAWGLAGLCVLALMPFALRWLDLLALENAVAAALGLRTDLARAAILLLAGAAASVATLAAGPLNFVGLVAPHLARLVGIRRTLPFLLSSLGAGATLTVAADWIGRTILFPYEIPAGLVTTMIGAPLFMWLLLRIPAGAPRE